MSAPDGRHRLRDLGGRGRLLVLVVALALAAPFVASVAKAVAVDWTPANDEALIAIRVQDVLSGDFPLVGQPSTAGGYADVDPPDHPGPIEFYLLAAPVALLGPDLGMLVGTGLLNLGAVWITVWVSFRRGGPAVGLGAAVVVSALAWSEGLAVLTDPISSNMGGIPILALAALAWALLDGDLRLVPLAAFVFAFVCQQHLAVVTVGLGLGVWAAVGIAVTIVAWQRSRADRPGDAPWPWLVGGALVSVVAWAPVVVDQFWGQGNLGRMARFASSSQRETLGLRSGATQALRALGMPPLVTRTDLTGNDLTAALSPLSVVVALAVVVALVAIVVVRWRTARAHALLAATTLVLAAVGAVNGSNVPVSIEAGRINFYRWTFVVSALAWLSLGWAVAAVLERYRPRRLADAVPALRVAGVVVVVAVAAASIAAGRPQVRRDQQVFGAARRLGAAAVTDVRGRPTVLLVTQGPSAVISTGPAVGLDLIDAGHELRVLPGLESAYGEHLVVDPGEHVDAVLLLASTNGGFASPQPGRLIRSEDLKAGQREAISRLADQARGQAVVPAERADEVLHDVLVRLVGAAGPELSDAMAATVARLGDDPEAVLQDRVAVALLAGGYLRAPHLDPDLLAEVDAAAGAESWGDDLIELRRLTVAQAEQAYDLELG